MTRYAEHECADCGVVLPANELYRVSDRVLSSVSQSTRLYRGTKGGIGVGGSSRETYRIRQLEVCPDCHQDRVDRAKRAALMRLIGALAVVAVIILVVVGIANSPRSSRGAEITNDTVPVAIDNGSMPINVAGPLPMPSGTPTTPAVAQPTPDPTVTPPPSDDRPPTPDRSYVEDNPVNRATQTALTNGRAEPWSSNGDRGFVTVSGAQDYPDRTCRNAYSTLNSRGEDRRTESVMWCQPKGGGVWEPAN